MRFPAILATAAVLLLAAGAPAAAQDPPPRIGPFVVDLVGAFPKLPDSQGLAESRGLSTTQLPGRGVAVDVGAHVYPFSIGGVTLGFGGAVFLVRARATPPLLPAVTAHVTSMSPQLSLNFGSGKGWSYISGGVGRSRWSSAPDGGDLQAADEAWVRTFDYGAGARWFAKPHVAFHFDVRMHAIDPGPSQASRPGSPLIRLMVLGAGVSVR